MTFAISLAYPEDLGRLSLMNNDIVLAERAVSPHAPTIQIDPGMPAVSGDTLKVSWQASDADGDALTYIVWYSPDASSRWYLAGMNLTDNHIELPTATLPGGSQAIVKVTATDGINTSESISVTTVSVADKKPQVAILSPKDTIQVAYQDPVVLSGQAFDLEDNILSSDHLRWSSSISGDLGAGATIVIDQLPPGTHTLTLTATDSSGNSAAASIQVTVETPAIPTPQAGPQSTVPRKLVQTWVLPGMIGVLSLGFIGLGLTLYFYSRTSKKKPLAKRNEPNTSPTPSLQQRSGSTLEPEPEISRSSPVKPNLSEELRKAQILSQSGRNTDAFSLLRQIVQAEPDNAQAWLFLGYTLANLKDMASAERCLLLAKKLNHPNADPALAWLRSKRQ